MSGSLIWNAVDDTSPTGITSGQWLPGSAEMRSVPSGSARIMQFEFEKTALDTGYNISVSFDNGCTLNANR
jgi:hypothetical protein